MSTLKLQLVDVFRAHYPGLFRTIAELLAAGARGVTCCNTSKHRRHADSVQLVRRRHQPSGRNHRRNLNRGSRVEFPARIIWLWQALLMQLQIAPDFGFPLEAVTETIAILAKRGSGKTYCAAVLVEEMVKAGLPVVVVDPIGVWWGLRSNARGDGPGLPIVIFGGDRADLPLGESMGAAIADLVVEQRFPPS